MRRILASLIAALVVSTVSTSAIARTEFPVEGFPGDATRPFECPSGKMLAGFAGNAGLWIDSIQPICAVANDNRTFRQPVVEGPEFGGRGGTRQTVYCPIGTVLAHVDGKFTANGQIASLALKCETVTGRQSAGLLYFGNKNYAGVSRADPRTTRSGFGEGMQLAQGCSANELPTGFAVNFGIHVSGFGLICDRIAYPVAAAPPPPPPQGPSVAHRLAFGGAWDTTMEGGFGFKLILQPQGNGSSPINGVEGPLEVVGAFTFSRFGDLAADAGQNDLNGTLRGVVAPHARTLVFGYFLHNGKSGSGNFTLSDDGQSITGSIENSDGKSTWNGTRAK